MEKLFYTENEIRELLDLGKTQTKALMRTEGFPSLKIGREYRVYKNELEKWASETRKIDLDYRGISRPLGDKVL